MPREWRRAGTSPIGPAIGSRGKGGGITRGLKRGDNITANILPKHSRMRCKSIPKYKKRFGINIKTEAVLVFTNRVVILLLLLLLAPPLLLPSKLLLLLQLLLRY